MCGILENEYQHHLDQARSRARSAGRGTGSLFLHASDIGWEQPRDPVSILRGSRSTVSSTVVRSSS